MKPNIARRSAIVLGAVALVGAVAAAGVVSMANPHFVGKVTATSVSPCGNVEVCWKEAGLGNNQNIDYVVSAEAHATYQCVNNGGNCPEAANKEEVFANVETTGTFNSGQNGQITECLEIAPPPTSLSCPGNQHVELLSVSYTNITVTDTTNGPSKTANPSSIGEDACFVCP